MGARVWALAMQVEDGGEPSALGLIVALAFIILMIASVWKVYIKAGEPGWASIVPIYNAIVMLRIAGRPAWWFLLFLVPFLNLVIVVIVTLNFASSFGKSALFGVGLILLPFIFWPLLAFGSAAYQGATAR